ncbi:Proline iminopeptidase [subsurface metagenome]
MKTFTTFLSRVIPVVVLLFVSCTNQQDQTQSSNYFTNEDSGLQTGNVKMISIKTSKGEFNVWTKRYGYNPDKKVLLLHGGPGATHEYFECFENFLPTEGIEFIYYDQLGSGNSVNPADTSLWNLPRFIEEVEQVRIALNLSKDNFYLLGHSWGGILAIEYALKYQDNLKGLVISNMMSSAPDYDEYAHEVLAKQMDPEILEAIMTFEEKGDFGNPEYMELLMPNFYEQHILRMPVTEWPEPLLRSFSKQNHEIYVMMQGPSEFGIAGKLENWDRSNDLQKIEIPTLIIGAEFDTMDTEHMKWMSEQFPNGTYLYCSNGSHCAMYDDQQVYFEGLINFLKE